MLIKYNFLVSFIEENWWLILIVAVGIFLVVLAVFLMLNRSKKHQKTIKINNSELFEYLGGKDNLISHSLNGTRLTLVLRDYTKVNREKLKEIGVERVVEMSNKYILVGQNVSEINKYLD